MEIEPATERDRELALLRNSINECRTKRDSLEHRLHSLECLIDDRCKTLGETENQIGSMKRQLASYCRDIEAKDREYCLLHRSVEERSIELMAMEEALKSVQNQIGECERDLRLKEEDCHWKLEMMDQLIRERGEVHEKMQRAIEVSGVDLAAKESRLCVVVGLIRDREQELQAKRVELHNIRRDCEWKEKELGEFSVRIDECNTEIRVKEEEVDSMRRLIDEERKEMERMKGNLLKEIELNKKKSDSFRRLMREKSEELEKKERKLGERLSEFESKEKQFEVRVEKFESKEKEFEERVKNIELREKQFKGKTKNLSSKMKQFEGQAKELESQKEQFIGKVEDLALKEKQFEVKEEKLESKQKELEGRAKEIELRDKQFEGQAKDLSSKEKKFEGQLKALESKEKQLEGQLQEFESKQMQFKEQVKEFDSKLKHCEEQMKEFDSEQKRFTIQVMVHKSKENELEVQQKMLELQVQELKVKEEQFEVRAKELESKEKEFEGQVKAIELRKEKLNRQLERHNSQEKQLEAQMKDLESKRNQYEEKLKELELKEAQFSVQLKELKSKEERIEDLESERNQLEEKLKKLESKEALVNMQLKGLKSREKQIEDLESKMNQYKEKVEELELKEAQFRLALKNLESEEIHFEGRVKDLQSKQNQLGRQQKELELKEKRCESLIKSFEEGQLSKEKSNNLLHQVKVEPQDFTDADSVSKCKKMELLCNLLKNHELLCSQVSDALQTSSDPGIAVLDTIKGSCPPQLRQEFAACDANFSRRLRNLLIDELKKFSPAISSLAKQEAVKFASDWKANVSATNTDCLEILEFFKFVATYEISSSFSEHELQRLLDILGHHGQAPQTLCDIEKLSGNQISPTTSDGRNLQLLSNEPELIGKDILACLQTSADPATIVLDIIQNPLFPQNRKGNEGIIIDESHIVILDQLMRISPSPHIRPHIRDTAKKLATDLKVNMNPCDENSLGVLGFLMLSSIYGLVSYFNEDEVFKLLEFAAHHKQAIELFRTLGFADKIEVFVQNLVEKKQYVDAARFICAYKLADKLNPIDLLRSEISRSEESSQNIGRMKSIEQKVRCNELELGILRKVLQCISDNNLGSQDLVDKVQSCILSQERRKEALIVLAKQKEELGHLVSKLSSALEVRQPEEKKRANKEFTENQLHQPEDKISSDIAVTENQVKVQQSKEKESANGAVTKNQVKVQQPKENKNANGAVTKNHVKVQQAKAKKPANGAVTMNQVKGQQPEAQKPAAVAMNQVQGQQPEENISTNEAVTMNQVQVQQPREKKRPIEAVPNGYPLPQQSGLDNKRPRTGATHSVPRVFASHYQHTFCPSGMRAPFGFPPNPIYYGVTGGVDYFCHPRPYPPFR